MGFEPDGDQAHALERIAAWFRECERRDGTPRACRERACTKTREPYWHTHGVTGRAPVLSLGGLAGSGKTSLVRTLEGALGVRAVYGTPTWKAAGVLARKMADDPDQAARVRTYHSMIYYATEVHRCRTAGAVLSEARQDDPREPLHCTQCGSGFARCGRHGGTECAMDAQPSFTLRAHLGGVRRLIVIDEASMLTEEQVEHVRGFGVPVLLTGDHGQLPPVKGEMNPWMREPELRLEGNHRQGQGSEGITAAARAVRTGSGRLALGHAPGLWVCERTDRSAAAVMAPDRFAPGPERIVITWRNTTRSAVNRIFHGDGPVRPGDRVIALRQGEPLAAGPGGEALGFTTPVHNGAAGTVEAVGETDSARRVPLTVRLDDPVLIRFGEDGDGDEDGQGPRTVTVERVLALAAADQFGRAEQLPLNGPEARPKGAMLWDYAYAVTAHKAQGSEYTSVIVIDENPRQDYGRWMYTALTRAVERALVIRW